MINKIPINISVKTKCKYCGIVLHLFLCIILLTNSFAFGATQEEIDKRKKNLEQQIEELTQEANRLEKEADKQRKEGNTYSSRISTINSEINGIQAEINQSELGIEETQQEILQQESYLQELQNKQNYYIFLLKKLLSDYAKTNSRSFLEVLITNNQFSDIFIQIKQREALNNSLNTTVRSISLLKKDIVAQQTELSTKAEEQVLSLRKQSSQQGALASKRYEHTQLLQRAKTNEAAAKNAASDIRKSIEEVRKQVYVLGNAGGGEEEGDTKAISSFGEAYDLAKNVEKLTGVRPAFLLALLKNESSWGASLGNCYIKQPIEHHITPFGTKTIVGKTKSGNVTDATKRLMKERDYKAFLIITADLGKDPYNTLVSCPHRSYGTGGAMGPAQFIPSTWLGYKERASNLIGRSANPWKTYDAFVVSAIKLANDGAKEQKETAEWKAAMRYYAGGNWNNPAFASYGNKVIALAKKYQADIDVLENN